MSTAPPRPTGTPKILSATSTRLRLAVVSLAVLALGSAVAPRQAETPLPSPEQGPAPLLGEQMSRATPAVEPFTGVQDVADRTRVHAVTVVAPATPTATLFSDSRDVDRPVAPVGFGVYVADGFVLTHAAALAGRAAVGLIAPNGVRIDGTVAAAEGDTGLVLLRVPSGGVPATLAAGLPAAGMIAVGTGRADGRAIALPAFVTSVGRDRFSVGTTSAALTPGAPLFTPAGDLLAVSPGADGDGEVFPAAAAVDRLLARTSNPTGVFGLVVQGIDAPLIPLLGERGVIVTEATAGGPAAGAGIAAGDVLVAVGETAIASAQAAASALTGVAPGTATALTILRQGREQVVEVTPVPAFELAGMARPPDSGPAASAVMTGDDLRRANLPPDAVVLRVGPTAVSTPQQARRLIAQRQGAVAVLVSRNEVRFVAVLPEQP